MAKLYISKYSSLTFNTFAPKSFERQVTYFQRFKTNEVISVQVISSPRTDYILEIYNCKGIKVKEATLNRIIIGSDSACFMFTFTIYSVDFSAWNYTAKLIQVGNATPIAISNPFVITNEVEDTVLLNYTNSVNNYDSIFNNNGTHLSFNFRMDGGFLSDSSKLNVENEFRRNQSQELDSLYSMPYKKESLTIGNSQGVPSWVADKVNCIFALDNVLIDGIEYIRSESEIPESSGSLADYYPFYIYKMNVERKDNVFTESYDVIIPEMLNTFSPEFSPEFD